MGIATRNNTDYGFTSNMGHSGIDYQSIFKHTLPLTTYIPEKKYHQEQFCYYDVINLASYDERLQPKTRCDEVVEDKKRDAGRWCEFASQHAQENNGKPWHYLLIPHDQIASNLSLDFLITEFS
jgi:hypothetical protein